MIFPAHSLAFLWISVIRVYYLGVLGSSKQVCEVELAKLNRGKYKLNLDVHSDYSLIGSQFLHFLVKFY